MAVSTLNRDSFLMSRKNDYVFKRIFGDERNKHLLVELLDAVLDETVEDVTILNPEFHKESVDERFGILDVKARTSMGTYIDIELQINPTEAYDKRILYYWAKLYSEQLKKGRGYHTLEKTIAISLVDYTVFKDQHLHHKFVLADVQKDVQYTDLIEFHFLELRKLDTFTKEALESGNMMALEEWLYFIATDDRITRDRKT
jgi:predicted transposase/invertase (TIGR01784 family)